MNLIKKGAMIKVEFYIWTWKDYKKWFWDKFCFPRRKIIAGWFDCFIDEMHSETVDCYVKSLGFEDLKDYIANVPASEEWRIEKFEKYLMAREKMQKEKIIKLILKCKEL